MYYDDSMHAQTLERMQVEAYRYFCESGSNTLLVLVHTINLRQMAQTCLLKLGRLLTNIYIAF